MGTEQVRSGNMPQGMYDFTQKERFQHRQSQTANHGSRVLRALGRDLESWILTLGHTEQRGDVGHLCSQKGTMGASGTLNAKEKLWRGVVYSL